jgi:hypothetical protein
VAFVKGSQHTAEAKARMSRSGKRRAARDRERLKLTPKAVRRYLAFRECAPGLKPIVRAAEEEMVDLVVDLTGGGTIEDLPAGKRLLVESAMQTLVASRAMFAMFVESRDVELASRMATQATTLHRALTTLGLERRAKEVDLAAYLREKAREDRAEKPNGDGPDMRHRLQRRTRSRREPARHVARESGPSCGSRPRSNMTRPTSSRGPVAVTNNRRTPMTIVMTDRDYKEDPWQLIEDSAYCSDHELDVSANDLVRRALEAIPEDTKPPKNFELYAVRHLLEIIEQKLPKPQRQ